MNTATIIPYDVLVSRRISRAEKRRGRWRSGSAGEETHLIRLLAVEPSLAVTAVIDKVLDLLQGDAREALYQIAMRYDGKGFTLGEDTPNRVRRFLSAELVLADVTPEEARRRYPSAVLALRVCRAREKCEALQGQVKGASGEEASLLFDRVVAAKRELERLEAERRSG